MKKRCTDPNQEGYARYGAKGISFDPSWSQFYAFLRDMGERPIGHTLDRKDSRKDYSKENCRWATPKQQGNNTSRNVWLEFNGERLTLSQWAEKLGVQRHTLKRRRLRGWSVERTLTEPVVCSRA